MKMKMKRKARVAVDESDSDLWEEATTGPQQATTGSKATTGSEEGAPNNSQDSTQPSTNVVRDVSDDSIEEEDGEDDEDYEDDESKTPHRLPMGKTITCKRLKKTHKSWDAFDAYLEHYAKQTFQIFRYIPLYSIYF